VKGKVPFYQEVFVDEGDLDMVKHHWPVLKPFESKTTSLKASVF
jgi:hypothetical protein